MHGKVTIAWTCFKKRGGSVLVSVSVSLFLLCWQDYLHHTIKKVKDLHQFLWCQNTYLHPGIKEISTYFFYITGRAICIIENGKSETGDLEGLYSVRGHVGS